MLCPTKLRSALVCWNGFALAGSANTTPPQAHATLHCSLKHRLHASMEYKSKGTYGALQAFCNP